MAVSNAGVKPGLRLDTPRNRIASSGRGACAGAVGRDDLLAQPLRLLQRLGGGGPIARYLDRAALGEGWLVMFDLRKEPSWSDKLFVRELEHAGKRIHLVGC